MVFLGLTAKDQLIPKAPRCITCFIFGPPKITFTVSTKTRPSQCYQNFFCAAFQKENSVLMLRFFPLMYTPSSPLRITLPSSFPIALTCLQPTFSRTTSGHWLEPCRPVHLFPPPVMIMKILPLTASSLFLSLSLSLSLLS